MQSGERQTAPEGLVQIILEIAIEFHVSEKRVRHAHAEHRPPVRVGLAKVVLREQRRTPLPRAGERIAVARAEIDAQRRDIRSEEGRVGKEGVRTGSTGGWRYH